jgi:Tfp pilus assembly protein PilN
MTMRRLELDFKKSGRSPGWAAWALLAVSFAFAFDLGRSWYVLDSEIRRKETQITARSGEVEPRRDMIKISTQPVKEGELLAARDTLRRLSIPWDALFGALEAAQSDRAWLLSIEPDVAQGTVTLTGEARDYLAALSYVANLEQQKALSRVYLAKHEIRPNDPQRPLAFVVSASWKERR